VTDEGIADWTAARIAGRVAAREVSALAVTEAHLARIARVNPAVNAICTLAADQARDAARILDADLAAGRDAGALAGVPVGIKDVIPTAGIRTTYGSALYADHVPTEDALIVRRLKAAGAIVIGKTNTPEFAAGANTVNAVFGATRNPWNLALSASGSTGGGAAALASGMIALADGTDLGGSLRTPAAFCGVVGLRPSLGLVPPDPSAVPWQTLSVAGPMARTVGDLALMLNAIAGPSSASPFAAPGAARDFVAAADSGIREGLRVAFCADVPRIGVDPEVEDGCRRAAFGLRAAGAVVDEIDLDLAFARQAFHRLRGQLMVDSHLDRLDDVDRLNQNLSGNIRMGLAQSPREVAEGERGRAQVFEAFRALFERFDILLTPTAPVQPFPVEQSHPTEINGRRLETYIDWVAPTFVVTLAGLPAISVPCGKSRSGMPIGIQVVGPRWGEERALAVSAVIESQHPIGPPPLAA
jgi:amidase